MKLNIFFYILLLLCLLNKFSYANEVFIEVKVDEEIITNLDIANEQKYLLALNNDLKDVEINRLKKLAKNSLIKEKIKEKEIKKFFDINKEDEVINKIIFNYYKRFNFNSYEEYSVYLSNHGLNIKEVEKKLKIEGLWNRLIYTKYINNLNIDKEKLKNELKMKIEKNKNNFEEYNLSELVFKLDYNETIEEKFNKIKNSIEKDGFKKASSFFSISETAKIGGEVGWINKTQLSELIIKKLDEIEAGNFTKPIEINNTYLILKINEKRKSEQKIDFENEFNKVINREKNKQLNNFSLIYFNKIKQNILISEI